MVAKKISKKKAVKKKTDKKHGDIEDPPVIVGGGNSVDITFKDTANPVTPPAGKKKFRLPNDITTIVIDDGSNPIPQFIKVSGAFRVLFF